MTEIEEDIKEEPEEIITKVEITNFKTEKDTSTWETEVPWEFAKMTEKDIEEAEEARNA